MNKIIELNKNEVGVIAGGNICTCADGTVEFIKYDACQKLCCYEKSNPSFIHTSFVPSNRPLPNIFLKNSGKTRYTQHGTCPRLNDAKVLSKIADVSIIEADIAITLASM
jgi:hypothetical protein